MDDDVRRTTTLTVTAVESGHWRNRLPYFAATRLEQGLGGDGRFGAGKGRYQVVIAGEVPTFRSPDDGEWSSYVLEM